MPQPRFIEVIQAHRSYQVLTVVLTGIAVYGVVRGVLDQYTSFPLTDKLLIALPCVILAAIAVMAWVGRADLGAQRDFEIAARALKSDFLIARRRIDYRLMRPDRALYRAPVDKFDKYESVLGLHRDFHATITRAAEAVKNFNDLMVPKDDRDKGDIEFEFMELTDARAAVQDALDAIDAL